MGDFSNVKVVNCPHLVRVPISSADKPEISGDFEKKWQDLVDLAARIIGVPTGLIMRLSEKDFEVFATGRNEHNPYRKGEKVKLGLGLYCETVVGRREKLQVPNALKDPDWKNNPDVKFNMISYLGVPLRWPDGKIFGTFCILDSKSHNYMADQQELLLRFAEMVETDLSILLQKNEAMSDLARKETLLHEMRHRIKNQLNILVSYIDLHQSSDETGIKDLPVHIRDRIKTLSRLHETLSTGGIGDSVCLTNFMEKIIREIVSAAPFEIKTHVLQADISVCEKLLLPLSMILNELLTNSIKHAFDGVDTPEISLEAMETEDALSIHYNDNGKYRSDTGTSPSGLGTMIIEAIANQLNARIHRDFQDGFSFRMEISRA